ncbi:MAG: hypothetical protein EHM93_05460 [Bacteroidales bacterium]|nr:MAG: hypothetical protein EHM93_05460 [Bacteroidales bacterium]
MKRIIICLFTCLSIALIFNSCKKDEESFDESLLIGKWQSGTVWEKYSADHKGGTWDTSDGVYEDDAQAFTWSLEKSDLTQIHIMEIGGNVPKYYTVTELTSTTLKYKDDFGISRTFSKR